MQPDLKKPSHFLAFGFGSGLAKFAPGTFGTIAAIPLVYGLLQLPLWLQIVLIILGFILGVSICDSAAKDIGSKDPSSIVWDEIIGYAITMFGISVLVAPIGGLPLSMSWPYWLIGFVLFRIFDIVKPWPISYLDKTIHGGMGIMIDDVVAGIFAALLFYAFFMMSNLVTV